MSKAPVVPSDEGGHRTGLPRGKLEEGAVQWHESRAPAGSVHELGNGDVLSAWHAFSVAQP
jgi:hypothetical protein